MPKLILSWKIKKVSDKKGKYASSYAQIIIRTSSRINKGQLVKYIQLKNLE